MEFREILGVDKNVSLEFFVSHLIEIVPEGSPTPAGRARADEIGFVASILADSTDTLATRGWNTARRNFGSFSNITFSDSQR